MPRTLSQDSGVESQECSQNDQPGSSTQNVKTTVSESTLKNRLISRQYLKRRAESADRNHKRIKTDYTESETSDCDSDSKPVTPLVKTISDPSLVIEETVKLTKKVISNSLKEKIDREVEGVSDKLEKDDNMCIICVSEPKSGVFVHGRIAHICCCYKCAVKVWSKAKRCPVCNCRVSNVLKAVIM